MLNAPKPPRGPLGQVAEVDLVRFRRAMAGREGRALDRLHETLIAARAEEASSQAAAEKDSILRRPLFRGATLGGIRQHNHRAGNHLAEEVGHRLSSRVSMSHMIQPCLHTVCQQVRWVDRQSVSTRTSIPIL